MPITVFNGFTDGLEAGLRLREQFTTDTKLKDDRLWVPYMENVWFQPCRFNVSRDLYQRRSRGGWRSRDGAHRRALSSAGTQHHRPTRVAAGSGRRGPLMLNCLEHFS